MHTHSCINLYVQFSQMQRVFGRWEETHMDVENRFESGTLELQSVNATCCITLPYHEGSSACLGSATWWKSKHINMSHETKAVMQQDKLLEGCSGAASSSAVSQLQGSGLIINSGYCLCGHLHVLSMFSDLDVQAILK